MTHKWRLLARLSIRQVRFLGAAIRAGQQVCKMCGRPQDEVDYTVAEHSWRAVVPHRWNGRALCLACFERCALDRNVHVVKVFLVNGP